MTGSEFAKKGLEVLDRAEKSMLDLSMLDYIEQNLEKVTAGRKQAVAIAELIALAYVSGKRDAFENISSMANSRSIRLQSVIKISVTDLDKLP